MARKNEPQTRAASLVKGAHSRISEFHKALTYPFRHIKGHYVFKSIFVLEKEVPKISEISLRNSSRRAWATWQPAPNEQYSKE